MSSDLEKLYHQAETEKDSTSVTKEFVTSMRKILRLTSSDGCKKEEDSMNDLEKAFQEWNERLATASETPIDLDTLHVRVLSLEMLMRDLKPCLVNGQRAGYIPSAPERNP